MVDSIKLWSQWIGSRKSRRQEMEEKKDKESQTSRGPHDTISGKQGTRKDRKLKRGFWWFFTRRQTALGLKPLRGACANKESETYRDSKLERLADPMVLICSLTWGPCTCIYTCSLVDSDTGGPWSTLCETQINSGLMIFNDWKKNMLHMQTQALPPDHKVKFQAPAEPACGLHPQPFANARNLRFWLCRWMGFSIS